MQTTDTVLMIEPIAFGYNAQTAENNYFQVEQKDSDTQQKALEEFNNANPTKKVSRSQNGGPRLH